MKPNFSWPVHTVGCNFLETHLNQTWTEIPQVPVMPNRPVLWSRSDRIVRPVTYYSFRIAPRNLVAGQNVRTICVVLQNKPEGEDRT